MKALIIIRTLVALLVVAGSARGAEVYFDTVSTAKAARLHGAYFSAGGGIADNVGVGTGPRLRGFDMSGDSGWSVGLKFGYAFVTPIPIRPSIELELNYLNSELHGEGGPLGQFDSELHAYSAMGNLVLALDFEEFRDNYGDVLAALKPYVGAGAGIGYVHQNDVRFTRTNGNVARKDEGGEASFGYQVFGGLEIELAPEFSLYGEYKYVNFYDLGNADIQGADFSVWSLGMKFQY
jgi:opacity protein-like surface antigen